jgi:hypothetical protein
MSDALAAPKNAVENLRSKVMGSFDAAELQAQQAGWNMLTDQCVASLVGLYHSSMVELSDEIVERWRWVDRNSFIDRWTCYGRWKLFATKQIMEVHVECLGRLRDKLAAIKNQPATYVSDAEGKLVNATSKVMRDMMLKLYEVRQERTHAFWTSVVHGFKWTAVTVGGALIALWVKDHFH